jgi:F420-dependent oxidoreductase-like protein
MAYALPVRLALMIEGQEGVSWEQWVALAHACEEHGIDTLFRSDHYISFEAPAEKGSLDAWTTMAGLAAATTTLRLGTLVSPITFRHPSVLAKAAATADHISGGRVELGLGAGWMEREHSAYGFPFPGLSERMEIFAEQIEIVHRQWTEQQFDFRGKHYVLEDCIALPKPVQSPHPPLIVGGKGRPGTVRPAARFADEYNTFQVTPEEFADIRRRVRETCQEEGRDPDTMRFSLMTGCVIGEERARRLYADRTPDDYVIMGSLDEVAAQIREYEAAGCERIMLQHLLHDDLDAIAEFGRELGPAVA